MRHGYKGVNRCEESPILTSTCKPSITKAARDMMVESRDKGIIQRVLDQIYKSFA